jgi:hypothetical protein
VTASDEPGRSCPLRYRYGAASLAQLPERPAHTLYVIGGLYGNLPALDTVEAMAAAEPTPPTLCFNGDFNWFNIKPAHFNAINQRVLHHEAIQGNVEAELGSEGNEAGCGCAYPDSVDIGTVERSNLIHQQLRRTAQQHPALLARLATLPMAARYRVGDARIAVVHGDADALAGWRFDVAALDDPSALPWLRSAFSAAQVEVFASTHTCLPAMRRFGLDESKAGWVLNNGATGMPNLAGDLRGLCTRIALTPSPHPVLHEVQAHGVYLALLPVAYDTARWEAEFLAQWPEGSAAHQSYFGRISRGTGFPMPPSPTVDRNI